MLLLLLRSALGRVVAILGLIAITSVLGYLAIAVPEGEGIGNVTFLLVMVGLTLLATAVAVIHPIAWTGEEMARHKERWLVELSREDIAELEGAGRAYLSRTNDIGALRKDDFPLPRLGGHLAAMEHQRTTMNGARQLNG